MGYSELSNAPVTSISSPYGIATAGMPVSATKLGPPVSSAKLDPFGYEMPSSRSELGVYRSESRPPLSSASLSPPPTTQSIYSPPPQPPSFAARTDFAMATGPPQTSSFAWSTSGLGIPSASPAPVSQVDGRPLTTESGVKYGSMPTYAGVTPSFSEMSGPMTVPRPAYASAPPAMLPPATGSPFKTTASGDFWGDVYKTGPTQASMYSDYVQPLGGSRVSTEAPYGIGPPPLAGTAYIQKVESDDEDQDDEAEDEEPIVWHEKTAEMSFGQKIDAQTTYYLGGYAQMNYPGQGDPREEMYVAVQKAPNTRAYRVEPSWMDGAWYLTAPVDFKGMEQMPDREYGELTTVDEAVRDLEEKRQLPPLPPPRHWKEHKSCPIA